MIRIIKENRLNTRIGWIEIDRISVSESQTAYGELEKTAAVYRTRYGDCPASQVEGVEHARQLFHMIGIDPTKRRPSSEALLRRALKNKSLYSVNTLVDVGNWCSLDFLLPICVYDADKIHGSVKIRIGTSSDKYDALNGSVLNLEGRYCLADDQGAFGSPITDSKHTAVDVNTKHTLFIIFGPGQYPEEKMKDHVGGSIQRICESCGGVVLGKGVI
ncbi:B3/4 domain-containing protein [bacterium]